MNGLGKFAPKLQQKCETTKLSAQKVALYFTSEPKRVTMEAIARLKVIFHYAERVSMKSGEGLRYVDREVGDAYLVCLEVHAYGFAV